jgi:hypothetical protein
VSVVNPDPEARCSRRVHNVASMWYCTTPLDLISGLGFTTEFYNVHRKMIGELKRVGKEAVMS